MRFAQDNFYKKIFGKIGEKKAVKYLKKLKYKILETNYATRVGEIDVIALDKNVVVFVEVKTRKNNLYGAPSEAVNTDKIRKYYKVATEYLLLSGLQDIDCRFDVIEIEDGKINHIIDAFSM